MKVDFTLMINGHSTNFARTSSFSGDVWYTVATTIDHHEIQFQLSRDVKGYWKIRTSRLPGIIHNSEIHLSYAIDKNEEKLMKASRLENV